MYKLHLILKYLRRRRIAWVSLIAVMLCTAMVLVVISVMGGWLRMFRASFQGLSGDIVVRTDSRTGFPYYEEMIAELEKLPEVEAAAPLIETYALINIENRVKDAVRVVGLPLDKIGRINGFWDSLYFKNPRTTPDQPLADLRALRAEDRAFYAGQLEEDVKAGKMTAAELEAQLKTLDEIFAEELASYEPWAAQARAQKTPTFDLPWDPEAYRRKLARDDRPKEAADPASFPGMIVGVGLLRQGKDAEGNMDRWLNFDQKDPYWIKFLTLAIDPEAANVDLERDTAERMFWIIDSSKSGVYETDAKTVYVDFHLLQQIGRAHV